MSPRARFDLPAQLFALDEVISCAGNTSNRPFASVDAMQLRVG
ncbi:hypothetical protein Bra1253DRAFT_02055 [Bradyrhizobium sp. WSM1253]|nr:hypothetical protein Bra1253DRAFT_02055 [Bradyrhizobium sp. WSM1253]